MLALWFMFGFLFVNCNTLQYLINFEFKHYERGEKNENCFLTYSCHSEKEEYEIMIMLRTILQSIMYVLPVFFRRFFLLSVLGNVKEYS